MGEYQMAQDAEGLKPTKYKLGNADTDGHTHYFYLRDHLPIATTLGYLSAEDTHRKRNHAHSIEEGPDNTVIVQEADGHIHTVLVIEEEGDYVPRTLA